MTFDPYEIILKPYVTEKTLLMLERENKLTFIVRRSATKREIKAAMERLFEVEVDQVNTIISKYGKKAIVKLKEGYSAEEVGMRLGIF